MGIFLAGPAGSLAAGELVRLAVPISGTQAWPERAAARLSSPHSSPRLGNSSTFTSLPGAVGKSTWLARKIFALQQFSQEFGKLI